MSEFPYLVAIGLIEQEGRRSMPLGGKSLRQPIHKGEIPKDIGETIAFELLVRIMQRSEKKPLRCVAEEKSLLLTAIPIEIMQKQLPSLKSEWIALGDTYKFISKLNQLSIGIWSIKFIKYEGVNFSKIQLQ